jgi:peptidoglycan/xylan/chitin deacetylase (PgdA/CDA1 family)
MRNLYYLILSWFAFPCLWFYRNRVRVLAYHTVNDKVNFEKQLKYISRHFNVISAKDFKQYLAGNIGFPKNTVLITFDDGDRSVLENGLPLLTKYKLPAVVFIITDLIDTHKPFWWDEIEYYLGKENGNKKIWEIKNWANIDRENYLLELRQNYKKPLLRYMQLTTSQLTEMQNEGVEIANHSHTHPMFNLCTAQELEYEIQESKGILSSLNSNPDIFAYPNGNYSDISEEILNKNGIKIAFLFDHKINKTKIHPLRISRLKLNDNTPLWKLKLILSGWHTRILPFTRTIGKFYRKFN